MRSTLALMFALSLILESGGQGTDDVILPPLIRARLFVSSLQGSDDQDGLSPDTALASLQNTFGITSGPRSSPGHQKAPKVRYQAHQNSDLSIDF